MWEALGFQARETGQDGGEINKGHPLSEAQLQGSPPPLVTTARRQKYNLGMKMGAGRLTTDGPERQGADPDLMAKNPLRTF